MNTKTPHGPFLGTLITFFLTLALGYSQPPDLRQPGVIAGIDRSSTYNLGATGLRGWIWVDRNNVGDIGKMTDPSRQILVTTASAPAHAVLQTDDVILGAIAANSGVVPDFSSDCRIAFAHAITNAEKTGAGTLRVKRWRAGVTDDVNIPITILGDYSTTAPFDCPKSTAILANARNQMVGELLANANYLGFGYHDAIHGLALLASVKDGDPNFSTVQSRLQTNARALANLGPRNHGLPIWDWSYQLLYLSEYYLLTNDAQVIPGIQSFTLTLAESQSIYGTYGHGPAAIRPDGTGRLVSTGYGPVNSVGVIANIALVLGKKALETASQSIDPKINTAILRGSNFFAFYVNKGSLPYGEHEPVAVNHASNGKDPAAAVFFALQPDRPTETEYFTRVAISTWIGREYGHTGQGFSFLWTALGAAMGGDHAAAEHLKKILWHLDLSRRTNSSFAYDGQEQYGGGFTQDGTYLGRSDHYSMNPTAIHLLTYSLPLKRLYITGKNLNPAHTLDTTKVAHAVSAGSFRLDRTTKTIAQLFANLGDYDPVVRHHTAVELATRTLSGTELTNLRSLLTSPDPNIRATACQTLGLRQDTTALSTIVGMLRDPDVWVRSKAATAIRSYSSTTASTHRDAMIDAFIANATDPQIIDWSDPIQMSNGKLSLALFGNAVPDGTPGNNIASFTINAPKQTHLYPALRVGLRQPDSYPRTGVTQFARTRLPVADVQALYPEFVEAIAFDTPADRMWSGDSRAEAISMMASLKITDGIPLALAMLDVPQNFEWGSGSYLVEALNAIASYGDAARYTLPTLKGYLTTWTPGSGEYTALVNAINTLENAIIAPAQAPGRCVAHSQITTTTGPTAITLTGSSPRPPGTVTWQLLTPPAHGTLTGTPPNLTYTPTPGHSGPDHFTFQTSDSLTTSATAGVGIVVGPSGNGLQAEYFDNANFTNPKLTRIDSQINFDWGTGSPHATIAADTFSVRWSGVLLVPETTTYTFSALTSDGVRIYLNGQLILDRFVDQDTRWSDSIPVPLSAGQMADLTIEYYENTGNAVAKLKWTGPSFAGLNGDIIPQPYLFDGSTIPNRPCFAFAQTLSTNRNTALPVTLSGSGGVLTYQILTPPANGTLSGTAPNLTYTPSAGFSGTDHFTFLVSNGSTHSLPATISINVQAGALTTFQWATATSGNWSDAARWTPSLPAAAGAPHYALNFAPSGTYTATHNLNNAFSLNQLNTSAAVTIDGTPSLSFTANGGTLPSASQNSTSNVTINTPLHLAANTTFTGTGSGSVTINGLISGPGGLVKNSVGILELYNATNTFTGGTILSSGTLIMQTLKNAALGSGPITLNPGATLRLERITASNALIVNGGTLFPTNGWGNTWNGAVTLNSTLLVTSDGNAGAMNFNAAISGPGGFTFNGPNALRPVLAVANTYTGPTRVFDCNVTCNHLNALGSGPLILTTPGRLTLNYTGTRVIESLTIDDVTLPPGTYGSSTHAASFSGTGTVTVPPPTTTSLNLTNGSTPANPGTALTFTATVSGSNPTGSVQFFSGTTPLGTATLGGSYQATFITSNLPLGLQEITARYLGNAANAPSTSSPLAIEINNQPVAAPTGLSATANLTKINLAWTSSPGATGYYVKRSTTPGGPYTVLALITGTSYEDATIAASTTYHYVIAAINSAGESPPSNEASAMIGSPGATLTTIQSSPTTPATYGTAITLTATVTTGSGTPAGTVTFRSGDTILGTGNLSSGSTSLVLSTLPVATHSVTARYEGSGPHDPSISAPIELIITPKPLTLTGVTASHKTYDATTVATLTGGILAGILNGDSVTLISGTGTFASPNVGTHPVTAAGFSLGGPHATNYTLAAQPSVANATITARPIHITGSKTYDGTTSISPAFLTIANNLDAANLALTLNGTPTLSGDNAGVHTLILPPVAAPLERIQTAKAGTSGNATSLTVTLPTAPASGNTLIAVISTRGTSANRISAITGGGVTWTRATQATNANGTTTEIWLGPNVATGTPAITLSHASLRVSAVVIEYRGLLTSGTLNVTADNTGNNNSPNTGTTAPTSQPNQLWIGGIATATSSPTLSNTGTFTAVDNAVSTGSGGGGNNTRIHALERLVTTTGTASASGTLSVNAQWSAAIATFHAAAISPLSLSGTAAANYTLTGMTSAITITPLPLTVTAVPASKTYDGTTTASGTPTLSSPLASGDSLISLTQSFQSADPGTGKTIIPSIQIDDGTQGGNYSLTLVPNTTGVITSPFTDWAATHAPSGTAADDFDGDGVSNGIEFYLGGDKNTNDLAKLPQMTTTATHWVFSFTRKRSSVPGVSSCVIEVGDTLTTWSGQYLVDSATPGITIEENTPTDFDKITLSIPKNAAPQTFARLKLTVIQP